MNPPIESEFQPPPGAANADRLVMNIIRYNLSPTQIRFWNADWFLRVEISAQEDGEQWVKITTAVPPGPATQVGGMFVANPFITFNLNGAEARLFREEYMKLLHQPA